MTIGVTHPNFSASPTLVPTQGTEDIFNHNQSQSLRSGPTLSLTQVVTSLQSESHVPFDWKTLDWSFMGGFSVISPPGVL